MLCFSRAMFLQETRQGFRVWFFLSPALVDSGTKKFHDLKCNCADKIQKKVLRMLHLFPFLFFFSFLSAHEPREYLEVRHLTQTTQTIATTPFLHAPREYPEVDSLPPVELRPRQGVAGKK